MVSLENAAEQCASFQNYLLFIWKMTQQYLTLAVLVLVAK